MKTALKNPSANCLRKFKGLQLTFQVVMGSIARVMIDKRSGQVAYAVLSFGGFLGIGND